MRATSINTCIKHTDDRLYGICNEATTEHNGRAPIPLTPAPIGNERQALNRDLESPTSTHSKPPTGASAALKRPLISERALVQRVNRRLAKAGQRLRKARPGRTWYRANFGLWSIFEPANNRIVWHHVDPLALAKALGVVLDHASLVGEES